MQKHSFKWVSSKVVFSEMLCKDKKGLGPTTTQDKLLHGLIITKSNKAIN